MELDLVSAMVVAEAMARDGSYAAWHGAHAGIGTLPILLFGTEDQKSRYLPKLARCEMIGAYCLSEAHAGSDALAARTRADMNAESTHYILNGQKNWITNGGRAGLFTVFAKVDGEKFTAFLVERGYPGVSTGAEEHKMGIKGSSTCAVFLDNVAVPKENVLGEIGRGHIIAFNILNLGRLKLGPFAVGGAKDVLAISLKYAKERKAFGHSIADFGMIQHKLAEMAIRIYAAESVSYRVAGLIESSGKPLLAACEEFAAECSIVKVYASEMLDYVVDEGVQIHGGYGFHADYAVERAYRDSRINRIFEGTNEINRMLITGLLLKRAQRGQLGLVKAAKSVMDEVLSGPAPAGLVANTRKIALLLLGLAYQKFLNDLEKQQEVLAGIADVIMEVFAMESVELRGNPDYRDVYLRDAMARIEVMARTVMAACSEGDALRANMAVLRRFSKYEPVDAITIRRRIAARLLEAGRYIA
jgi:alkylation response protein AidB-like acyl-CoA dehydrogenase